MRASEAAGTVIVWKPFVAQYWVRNFATPDSDVGATLLIEPSDFAEHGLADMSAAVPIAPEE